MAETRPQVRGGDSEHSIDTVNQWMRSQPWYMQFLQSQGQSPDNVKLSKAQAAQLTKLAQANGVMVDEGKIEVDPAGNFNPRGHKMRNTLIGLGAAAAIAAPFVAPALLGAGGATGAAAVPTLGGGSTLAAGLGGASALPALTGAGAAAAGAGGVAGAISATEAGIYGGAGLSGAPAATASTGGTGLLSRVGGLLRGGRASDILSAAGRMASDGTQAAGQNRLDAYDQNLRATSQYENQLMNRSADEQKQRNKALDDVYRASWYANRQASPNNTRGLTAISPELQATMDALKAQGQAKLATGAQYDSDAVDPLTQPTPSQPGTLERVGTYAGPILTGLGTVGKILSRRPAAS